MIVHIIYYMALNDKLYFYSKSKNVLTGKGVNEYITDTYDELNKIEN